jgi:CubicO group peptidase (beta-lactamase class C family)
MSAPQHATARTLPDWNDGLPRAAPSATGVNADALIRFLDEVEAAGLDMHSFMLHRQGKVVAEGWRWPYRADRPRVLHSAAKSYTACAIGLAIEEGLLKISDKVISFFPDELPDPVSENLAAMTVEDLLTMRTGHATETSGSVWRNIPTSWTGEFFKIPLAHAPGTHYVYTSAASYMLSAIIGRVTGITMHEYLKPRLFAPLGIHDEEWSIGPDGVNPGGNGLTARTADMLKLGILHAQGGLWEGKRVLPLAWVQAATRAQGGDDSIYGYQWQIRPAGAYSAIGQFVQFVTVYPEHDATFAVTAAIDQSALLFPYMQQYLLQAFATAPGSAEADLRLRNKITAWEAPTPPQASAATALQSEIAGIDFAIDANAAGVRQVRVSFGPGHCDFQLTDAGGAHLIRAGLGQWLESTTDMPGQDLHHGYTFEKEPVVANAHWRDAQTLEMTWIFPQTAFRDTVVCTFKGNGLRIERGVNVNSSVMQHPTLIGRAVR